MRKQLLISIREGKYDMSPFFEEAKELYMEGEREYERVLKGSTDPSSFAAKEEANTVRRKYVKKAIELNKRALEDEAIKLNSLRVDLNRYFGHDLWDMAMNSPGITDIESIYWWYVDKLKKDDE